MVLWGRSVEGLRDNGFTVKGLNSLDDGVFGGYSERLTR